MTSRNVLVLFLFVLILLVSTEGKKKRGWSNQRSLRRFCRKNQNNTAQNSALELHAFFDFTPKRRAFACLKITTCLGKPVCFVTRYPNLKGRAKNDSSTWWRLISYMQKDRKIEPIYDSSLNGWNGDKYKVLSKYVHNQPAIYRMCLDATIFRFVNNKPKNRNKKNVTRTNSTSPVKRAVNSSMAQSFPNISKAMPSGSNLDPISLCLPFTKTKKKRARHTPMEFMFCQGQDCPCVRICVGQGRNKTNFHDCSTFRIICTFDCASAKTSAAPSIKPQGYSKSKTPTPRRRPTGKGRKSRTHKKKKKTRRKVKPKKGKNPLLKLGVGK